MPNILKCRERENYEESFKEEGFVWDPTDDAENAAILVKKAFDRLK